MTELSLLFLLIGLMIWGSSGWASKQWKSRNSEVNNQIASFFVTLGVGVFLEFLLRPQIAWTFHLPTNGLMSIVRRRSFTGTTNP